MALEFHRGDEHPSLVRATPLKRASQPNPQ
jgi:hypothetical protein